MIKLLIIPILIFCAWIFIVWFIFSGINRTIDTAVEEHGSLSKGIGVEIGEMINNFKDGYNKSEIIK